MSAIPCAIAASPPGARSGRSRGTNACRRSLCRVSWMISRARAARRHRSRVQDRKCGDLAQTGGGRWLAAFERLLPARRERDLIAELRRHAIVATGLLTRCMLFGGARDIRTARGGEWHHSTVCNRLARARRADELLAHQPLLGDRRAAHLARPLAQARGLLK